MTAGHVAEGLVEHAPSPEDSPAGPGSVYAAYPPSTGNATPVTKEARAEHR
jgi:hypothetical protein